MTSAQRYNKKLFKIFEPISKSITHKITITYKNGVEVYEGTEAEVYEIVKTIRSKKEYVSYIIIKE